MKTTIKEALISDWDILYPFYCQAYRANHPLQNKEFWDWQYGDENFGKAYICIDESKKVVGHLGANFSDDIAWTLNAFLLPDYRGKGIMSKLHDKFRNYFPLAATSASSLGLDMYKKMGWNRYYDLERYVKINPNVKNNSVSELCKVILVNIDDLIVKDTHYFRQPTLKGIELKDGSRGVSQEQVGGFRVTDIKSLLEMENQVWELGYLWMDYITSWNDLKTFDLKNNGWVLDYKSSIPWNLNPVQEGVFSKISFLSEKPLKHNFIVHRSHSDHGRVGSII